MANETGFADHLLSTECGPAARSESALQGHTPGPWEIFGTYFDVYRADSSDYICQASKAAGESREANARLIAAAPELLDAAHALDKLMKQREDELGCLSDEMAAVVAKARAAIAKVQGSPQ